MTAPLAPFGRETRYVSRLYLQRVFVVAAATMAIVLALDLASNMTWLLSDRAAASGRDGFARLAYYLGLRAAYNTPAILPIAAVVGVVWAEFALAASYERLMIFNSGRSPLRSLVPAILVGLLLGSAQFAALSYAQPFAVAAQARSNFRDYGPSFHPDSVTGRKWIAIEDALVNARIEFGHPVTLRDMIVYGLDRDGQLEIVVSAERAVPAAEPGMWALSSGSWWGRPASPAQGGAGAGGGAEAAFENAEIKLPLDPLWVANYEVPARFLPQKVIRALGSGGPGIPEAFSYRTTYQTRLASLLYPLAMTLLGATLCLLMLGPRVRPMVSVKIGLAGYGVHVASKVLTTLGEYGYVTPVVAAWALPVAVAGGALLVLACRERKVRRSLARQAAG